MNQISIRLVPNSFEGRRETFSLSEQAWKRAVLLVDKVGYRPNSFSGLDMRSAAYFAQQLRQAIASEKTPEPGVNELTGLLAFLNGAGAGGFALTRGFKGWNQS